MRIPYIELRKLYPGEFRWHFSGNRNYVAIHGLGYFFFIMR
jgi:hypothetical protein